MANVEPGYAAWLKTPARYVGATISTAVATWGDRAEDSAVISPLAFKADAQAVATQEAQMLAGPLVRDKVLVAGLHADKFGQTITIEGDRSGYEGGAVVIVIGAQENATVRSTILTVIKRL